MCNCSRAACLISVVSSFFFVVYSVCLSVCTLVVLWYFSLQLFGEIKFMYIKIKKKIIITGDQQELLSLAVVTFMIFVAQFCLYLWLISGSTVEAVDIQYVEYKLWYYKHTKVKSTAVETVRPHVTYVISTGYYHVMTLRKWKLFTNMLRLLPNSII